MKWDYKANKISQIYAASIVVRIWDLIQNLTRDILYLTPF